MKKFLLSAAAATMVAAPIMAAAPAEAAQRHETVTIKHKANGRTVIKERRVVNNRPVYRTSYRTTYRPQYRNWARGQRFDYRYAPNYRVVTNYRGYHRLYAPPRGYHWVRSGNDAVLVAITSGLIGAVIGGAFN
jgi:Ni/Co efflux regulator RcnB